MILLDAFALLAAATGEEAADEVAELLRTGDCGVTTVDLAELYDQLVRRVGLSPEAVDAHVRPLLEESLAVRTLDRERAAQAGLLRAQLYRRRTAELSLADCVLLASLEETDGVATADPPLARAARRLGYAVTGLPDSRGRRP
ncbi:MAG TPA: PIN domain-containing protein [Gaiellaceae bacterium]